MFTVQPSAGMQQLPALPTLSQSERAAIADTFVAMHPNNAKWTSELVDEYMKFMWLKATQSSGVILAPSNAIDAVWHGQRSVCRSLSPCFLGALRPSRLRRVAHALSFVFQAH
jgi:hypothetical protein